MISIKNIYIIYKKFIKAKHSAQKKILYNEFKHYRNLVTKLSRVSKTKHYQHYHNKNILKTWEGIKLLVNMNERNQKTVICLNVDGIEETDQFLIYNHFNKFFSTIVQKSDGKIVKTNKHFSDFLTEPLQSNFFLTPTLSLEIQEIIKSLNNKKTTRHNSTSTNLLNIFGKMTSIPLGNLINLSFKCRIFLMSLKVASVTPTHKKGDSLDRNNNKKLYNFLEIQEIHEVLYEHQYGFQKKHSTNHAPIDITEKIRSALDQNIFACSIFIEKKSV